MKNYFLILDFILSEFEMDFLPVRCKCFLVKIRVGWDMCL